jgi:hypothetical protein
MMPSLCALPLVSADGIPSLRIDVSAPVGSREEGLRSQPLGVRSSRATIESAQIETYFSVSLPTPSQLLYQIRCIRFITAFEFLLSICALVVFQSIPTVLPPLPPSFFSAFPSGPVIESCKYSIKTSLFLGPTTRLYHISDKKKIKKRRRILPHSTKSVLGIRNLAGWECHAWEHIPPYSSTGREAPISRRRRDPRCLRWSVRDCPSVHMIGLRDPIPNGSVNSDDRPSSHGHAIG